MRLLLIARNDGYIYHEETIPDPKLFPTTWTLWYSHSLTVNRDCPGWGLANRTSRDVSANLRCWYWSHRHRHGFRRAQPVAELFSVCVVALIVQVAERERHSIEFYDATSGRT